MTAGYSNVNNFIVILVDDRDPWVSWANHVARGSAGGVDVVAPVGTPIYAPADCVVANTAWNGTGGHTITMSFSDGWRDQMMHLSRFVAPGFKRKGELVGYSGATASGKTYGVAPHVHWHRIDPSGVRRNPWDYFTGSGLAGGGTTPIEEDDMYEPADRTRDNLTHAKAKEAVKLLTTIRSEVEGLRRQVGGGKDRETTLRQDMDWVQAEIGGTYADGVTLTDRLRQIEGALGTVALVVADGVTAAQLEAASSQLLAAIATVDEETLKTFGLQRI